MTTDVLFNQLKDIEKTVNTLIVIIEYFNPMFQYGAKAFCKKCQDI